MSDAAEPGPSHGAAPGSFGMLFRRAFRADLSPGVLLADEHSPIEVEKIHGGSEPLGRLLLWRRGALFAALVFLVPSTLIHLIRDLVGLGDDAAPLSGLSLLVTVANAGLCVAVVVAFRRWERWVSSRRLVLWGWLVAFLVPCLVALFPLRSFAQEQGMVGAGEVLVGAVGAMNALLGLAPKALSLLPGLLRAAFVVKALFPGSGVPGWLVLLATPCYLLLLFVALLLPYQLAGGGLMALALTCFLAAPIFLAVAGRRLARPGELAPALAVIHAARGASGLLNGAGGLLLFIGLVDLVGTLKLNPLDAIAPLVGVVANVFLFCVVGVDATLVALTRAHVTCETPEETAARAEHEREMSEFIAAQNEHQRDSSSVPM